LNEERKSLIKRGEETERNRGNEEIMETRGKPRIIENIQIASPRDEYKKIRLGLGNKEEWDQWSDSSLILMNRKAREAEIGQDSKIEE